MAQRPIWRGQLRLALVSCPVALYSTRHDRAAIRFNMINPATGNRIKMISQDSGTGEEVARRDTVKGYEFKKDHYLLLTDEDLDSVKVEGSSTLTVEKFVDAHSIDPIYYDTSYYLAPDGKGSEDVYAVIRAAIEKTGQVALTRVVIAQRERTIAIRIMGDGLVAQSLNEERDLNSAGELFVAAQHASVDPEMVQLAVQLVKRQSGSYDPSDLEDRYETRLRAMLDARLKGEGVVAEEQEASAAPSNVVDIMALLKRSLAGTDAGAPAASAAKPGPARKSKAQSTEEVRRQPGLKLPIEGGAARQSATVEQAGGTAAQAPKQRRKA